MKAPGGWGRREGEEGLMWLVVTEELLLTGGQLHCAQRAP